MLKQFSAALVIVGFSATSVLALDVDPTLPDYKKAAGVGGGGRGWGGPIPLTNAGRRGGLPKAPPNSGPPSRGTTRWRYPRRGVCTPWDLPFPLYGRWGLPGVGDTHPPGGRKAYENLREQLKTYGNQRTHTNRYTKHQMKPHENL